MLSRIARGLFALGRYIERSQNVVRVLEVNHKMNLERASVDEGNIWAAISESFGCELDDPTEAELYDVLVLGDAHPYSVRRCIARARDEGRSMRDHISEEMWLHLNATHLEFARLSYGEILRMGRSEFNRRVEVFGEAFHGLANDTLIRGEAWAFLSVGKLVERACLVCRILDIKRKALALAPELEGAPLDVHQWQALLRSLSGYEPYRRAYDARIVPEQVLAFVMKREDFPRSLACTLRDLGAVLEHVSHETSAQGHLARDVATFLDQLRALDTSELSHSGGFEGELRHLQTRCDHLGEAVELSFFTSLRPPSAPIAPARGARLVPQQ